MLKPLQGNWGNIISSPRALPWAIGLRAFSPQDDMTNIQECDITPNAG